ncbi:hypothetical protein ECP02989429_2888, partial [Escherichia coli P0298942.9]
QQINNAIKKAKRFRILQTTRSWHQFVINPTHYPSN